jgi:hypothetical protein
MCDCAEIKSIFSEAFLIVVRRTVVRIDLESTEFVEVDFTGALPTRRLGGLPSPSTYDSSRCERRAGQRYCRRDVDAGWSG